MTMSREELERQVRQHGNDLESIYELLVAMDAKIDDVHESLAARLDGHDARFDAHDARFDAIDETLAEILRRLPDAS